MKRVYKSKKSRKACVSTRLSHPEETWEHFRRRIRMGYKDVKNKFCRTNTVYVPIAKSVSS